MKNQAINQIEVQTPIFTTPTKAIITDIVFTTGEKSTLVTTIPKGVLADHIQIGIIHSLSMQSNIVSCKSDVYFNCDGKMKCSQSFGIYFFNNENRVPSPKKKEYQWSSIDYLN